MQHNSTTEQMLKRLAEHREKLAEAGNIATARYDKTANDAVTREIHLYWNDMTQYYQREHDG